MIGVKRWVAAFLLPWSNHAKRFECERQSRSPAPLPVPQIPVPGRDQSPRSWRLAVEPSVDKLNTVITVKGIWHELPPKELGEFLVEVGKGLQGID